MLHDATIQDVNNGEPRTLIFRVEQVIRGSDADRIITYGVMDTYNDPAPRGREYVLVVVLMDLKAGVLGGNYLVRGSDFELVGDGWTSKYRSIPLDCMTAGEVSSQMLTAVSLSGFYLSRGWLCFDIPAGQDFLIRYTGHDGRQTWFNIK